MQENYLVKENKQIAKDTYRLLLVGNTKKIKKPGQFVNIKIPGFYLRRPISVSNWNEAELTLIYKILGEGTRKLAEVSVNTTLDVLSGLGNGFSLPKEKEKKVVLIGGGVGIPPLYGLAKFLLKNNYTPEVILGCNTKEELFLVEEFRALGLTVHLCTMDGSAGTKGVVTDVMRAQDLCDAYFYACGPMGMLKAIYALSTAAGEFSLEERMGCGFGACMGCSIETTKGAMRICKEGPVFQKEVLLW